MPPSDAALVRRVAALEAAIAALTDDHAALKAWLNTIASLSYPWLRK